MTNISILTGRLTRPARLTHTGDRARAAFTIAVDGIGDKTDFLPIVAFGKLAENVAEYTDKGHLVTVEGRITSGKYVNDNGETVYTIDIIANRVNFISKPRTVTTTPEPAEPAADNADTF